MRIKIGDKLPNSELFYLDQNNVVKKIDILDLCKGKTIILGMTGAFTKTCSALHLPGYIKNYDLATEKGITKIVCIAVNDPNVMKAWGENQNAGSKIFMAGDPFLKFTKAIGAEVDKPCGKKENQVAWSTRLMRFLLMMTKTPFGLRYQLAELEQVVM